ncbi:MAG: dihydropteroate synthase [Chitinophagaceae bacterium]
MSEQEETDRIIPAIELLHRHFPDTWLSVDTYRSSVARQAVAAGAHLVNDISGGLFDDTMLSAVAELGVPYILMHLRGTPETMHQPSGYGNVTEGVYDDLQHALRRCTEAGIKDVILDPGFGFSKTLQENYNLMNHLSALRGMGRPVLTGISRKSIIYKTLGNTAEDALNGTTALHMVALQQGSTLLRVHDVAAAREAITLFEML